MAITKQKYIAAGSLQIPSGTGRSIQLNNKLFNVEYFTVLSASIARGVMTAGVAEQYLQNKLVVDLKAAGIWDKLDALYIFANSTFTGSVYNGSGSSLINWKNPSSNYGTANSSLPTITSLTGFTGNGTDQGINLNFFANSGSNFKNPNASFGVLLGYPSSGSGSPIMGAGNGINRLRQTGSLLAAGASFTEQNFNSGSFIHLNRKGSNSTDTGIYVNGVRTQGVGAAWTVDSSSFNILRYGDLASFGDSQVKAAFIGGDLSNEAAVFSSIMRGYIASLYAIGSYASYVDMSNDLQYTILSELPAFEARVLTDGGTIEAQPYINSIISTLQNINLV